MIAEYMVIGVLAAVVVGLLCMLTKIIGFNRGQQEIIRNQTQEIRMLTDLLDYEEQEFPGDAWKRSRN